MLNLLNVTCLNCIQHTQSGINPSSLTAILKTKIPAKCVCRVPVREPVLLFAWPFIKVNHPWSSLDWWLLTSLSCRLIREPVNKQLTGLISILICRLLPPCVHVFSIFFLTYCYITLNIYSGVHTFMMTLAKNGLHFANLSPCLIFVLGLILEWPYMNKKDK